MTTAHSNVGTRIVEAAVTITPEPGVDIYDALISAELRGFRSITVHDDNTATVVLYQED